MSQSRTLETPLFSRQLLHHTTRGAALCMIGLRLLLLMEMWHSCTTTKYAGIKEWIPVLFISCGTLSPITEKLAAPVVQSCVHSQGRGKLAKGFVACQQRMALCGVWLGWTCDSSLLPVLITGHHPLQSYSCPLSFSCGQMFPILSLINEWVGTEMFNWMNCFSTG